MSREFSQNIVENGKIIDFHTHPYRHRGEFMGMYGEHFYLEPEQMPGDLAEAGISVFCGSVIDSDHRGAMESFDRVREVNDAALQLREKFGSAYVPGFHVHPAFLKESLEEVERMHREGVKLVGELVPYLQGWQHAGCDYGSEALTEILARAGEYGMIVSYHTMPEWPEQTEVMVGSNPGVTFVAAHPGQKADYLLHVGRMKKYPNLNLDISGTGLFRVQAVLGEHISDEDKEKILFGNAKRILGI